MRAINANDMIEEIARRDTTDGTVKVFSGKEIISILQGLPDAEDRWVSVKKQLPENPTQNYNLMLYLVCFKNGTMATLSWCDGWNCCFNEDDTIYRDSEIKDVVAWMPLPKPYKEVHNERFNR